LARVVLQIEAALKVDWLRQDKMWSLVGRIMHYAPLIPAGRFNLDYLIKANPEFKVKAHYRKLFFCANCPMNPIDKWYFSLLSAH
jgi:hypothetical protein